MSKEKSRTERSSCSTGGCGEDKGMCPRIAISIALLAFVGVTALTGIEWLGIVVGAVVALALLLGFYPGGGRWPQKGKRPL